MDTNGFEDDSDENNTKLILYMCLDNFLHDFAFEDIAPYVNSEVLVFTEDELVKLSKVPSGDGKTILMFNILSRKKNLNSFLNILSCDYDWLKTNIEKAYSDYKLENDSIDMYVNCVHELKSNFPKHSDYNVTRLEYFSETRSLLKRLKPWRHLVIYGELGLGKKWLALDACCDYSVMKSMGYKILWMDVHNCDSQEMDLAKLQRLKILLGESSTQTKIGDYEGITNKILELQQDIRTILKKDEYKDCLLVLCDVQNRKTLEAFALPCKILITTRNKRIMKHLSNESFNINISKGLTCLESTELFERVLEEDEKSFPDDLKDILENSRNHPFLLNIIAQHLKDDMSDEKWNIWKKNIENLSFENETINSVIVFSLNVLKPEELELYHTLAIFHHSVKIPLTVIAAFWNKSQKETEAIIKKFDKFSLINLKNDNIGFSIHILYSNYLQNLDNVDKENLNKLLVESYDIKKALQTRTDLESMDSWNDNYFHYYIGYHLKQAKMTELFPILYFDFGFLGQKLRTTGLPNTIGDLKYFENEIIGTDPRNKELIDCLLDFLPNIEEMIFKSKDTCLLQYALMTDGLLYSEAVSQAKNYLHRVWFSDSDHFHRRRQIVPLNAKPTILKLIEANTCLVGLENHDILVADLSLGYSTKPTCFTGHSHKIIRIELFTENFFMSLDEGGEIQIWSICHERKRVTRKESTRFIVNQIDYSSFERIRRRRSVQSITGNIKSFYIEKSWENEIFLYMILLNGTIKIHKWNEERQKFCHEIQPDFPTKHLDVRFLLKIQNKFMILTKSGSLKFYNLRDGSECPYQFQLPSSVKNPINVHYYHNNHNEDVIIFVFATKIFRVRLPSMQYHEFLKGAIEDLYDVDANHSSITCSVISENKRYLIVGTQQGILVFDTIEESEVLHNSISDYITCVDICSLDDEIYKYVIISGTKGQKILNIFGLKINGNDSITWANSIGTLVNEHNLNLRFEPTAWLMGKQLFDASFVDSKVLVAIDSKNRIHQLIENKWSMILPIDNQKNKITAISAYDRKYCYGCEDGFIYDSCEKRLQTNLNGPITFLKLFTDDILIASAKDNFAIKYGDEIRILKLQVGACFIVSGNYFVIVERNCSTSVLNIEDNFKIIDKILIQHEDAEHYLGGCDFKNNFLILGTTKCNIYIFKINSDNMELSEDLHCSSGHNYPITKVKISSDCSLCAIGYKYGLIEIYRIQTWELIQKLESHQYDIYDMLFSPWTDPNLPIILVSISEQICFWDITYVLNNPIDKRNGNNRRQSSRYNSKRNSTGSRRQSVTQSADVTDFPMQKFINNYWMGKRGPSDKPELLSCIKFAGNRAEKLFTNDNFTKFITIDDEGEIYFFNVKDIHMNGDITTQYTQCNGNGKI